MISHCIGICGPKGSGKTTLARLLAEHHGYSPQPFSQFLKSMLDAFLKDQGVSAEIRYSMLWGGLKDRPCEALAHNTPRRAMQTLGTEWRNMFAVDLWTSAWIRKLSHYERVLSLAPGVVVDDLRFPCEVEAMYGVAHKVSILRLSRDGTDLDGDSHPSEQAWRDIPAITIANNSTPEDMLTQLPTDIISVKLD